MLEVAPFESWAKIEDNAQQLDEAGMYSAVPFNKHDWIASMCWYLFAPSKTNAEGDRFYRKKIFLMDTLQFYYRVPHKTNTIEMGWTVLHAQKSS